MVMPCSRSAARPSTSSAKSMSSPCVPWRRLSAASAASWSSNSSLRVVQQAPDQRALAVVHAAAGDEAQQVLGFVLLQVARRRRVVGMRHAVARIRSSPPASSSPSTRDGSWSITRPWRSEVRRDQHLGDDLFQRVGVGFDRAGERIAAQRAEAHAAACAGVSPSAQRQALVVDHDQRAVALDHRALRGEIQRRHRDASRGRCTATRRARSSSTAGTRAPLSPAWMRVLYRFHSSGRWFFGSQRCCALRKENTRSLARDFSSSRRAPPIAASKPPLVQRLLQRLGLHHVGVHGGAVA